MDLSTKSETESYNGRVKQQTPVAMAKGAVCFQKSLPYGFQAQYLIPA